MRVAGIALMMLTGACSPATVEVDSNVVSDAEAFIREKRGDLVATNFTSQWYGLNNPNSQLICGEFEAPRELKAEQLRYVYDFGHEYGQVEIHELMFTASPVTRAILDENIVVFDDLWETSCEPFRPGRFLLW